MFSVTHNIGTGWILSGHVHSLVTVVSVYIERRLYGLRSWSGRFEETKILRPCPELNCSSLIDQPIAQALQ